MDNDNNALVKMVTNIVSKREDNIAERKKRQVLSILNMKTWIESPILKNCSSHKRKSDLKITKKLLNTWKKMAQTWMKKAAKKSN